MALDASGHRAPVEQSVHGTAVAIAGHAALLVGPSGAGKSDLALRLVSTRFRLGTEEAAPRLVGDDRLVVEPCGNGLVVRPAPTLAGLVEVRGLGIVPIEHVPQARLALVVDLDPLARIERLPEPEQHRVVRGVRVPLLYVAAFEASAPVKIVWALARAGAAAPRVPAHMPQVAGADTDGAAMIVSAR